MDEGKSVFVSGVEEIDGTKEIGGEEEERGSEIEGTKGRGSGMTTRGEKPGRGDVVEHVYNYNFLSTFKKNGVNHWITTHYHPQANGQVEESNIEMKKTMKKS